jgi:hypothetical protein
VLPIDVNTYDTPKKKHISVSIETLTKLVTNFLSEIKADTYVTQQSNDASIKESFKMQLYEILRTLQDNRKDIKTSKLISQATADQYIDILKCYKNVKPATRTVLINNVYQRYYLMASA